MSDDEASAFFRWGSIKWQEREVLIRSTRLQAILTRSSCSGRLGGLGCDGVHLDVRGLEGRSLRGLLLSEHCHQRGGGRGRDRRQ